MKHKIVYWAIVAIAATISTFSIHLFANGTSFSDGNVVIILNPKPISHPNQPRTPANNPFYAELTELGVLLATDSDWGEATVTLSSVLGDYYQTIFDMADGLILLPVNGDAGDNYTLTITLESGLEFEGEFCL